METREAPLRAVIMVFAETGTPGATTRRIAHKAGVNEVTLFRHFRSKNDLQRATLQFFAGQAARLALPDDPVDPRSELIRWWRVSASRTLQGSGAGFAG